MISTGGVFLYKQVVADFHTCKVTSICASVDKNLAPEGKLIPMSI